MSVGGISGATAMTRAYPSPQPAAAAAPAAPVSGGDGKAEMIMAFIQRTQQQELQVVQSLLDPGSLLSITV
jgi:hypothetical protein